MAKIIPFEEFTEQYEDWFIKNKTVYQSELLAIKKLLPKGKNGIEIGVGTGQFGAPLGIKIGIEPSRKMGKIAQQRGIKVIEAVAEDIPIANESFDFALMVTTICFLDDIRSAFKEVYRVLKKEGSFIIGFIDKDTPLGKLYKEGKSKSNFYKIATFYSVDTVVFHLRQACFEDFIFSQTIFSSLEETKEIEDIKEGYGKGAFVIIKAKKGALEAL